jgi:hypothetical protein
MFLKTFSLLFVAIAAMTPRMKRKLARLSEFYSSYVVYAIYSN